VVRWARVLENGQCLASATGANPEVVTLFALFHDSRRINEYHDEGHGLRGGGCCLHYEREFLKLIAVPSGILALMGTATRQGIHPDGVAMRKLNLLAPWLPGIQRSCQATPEFVRKFVAGYPVRVVPGILSLVV
jgi:uncharacterized protein